MKKLFIGVLIGLVLLLTGCVPLITGPLTMILLILDVAVQVIAAIGFICAVFRRFRSR